MLVEVLFYVFATILIAAALAVIIARNPVHAALFLVLSFITSAAIWLLIEAEFLAIVLVLVYVGAVMVLFLFVVMMLDIKVEEHRGGFTRYAWLGWITAAVVIVEITRGATPLPASYSNTQELGSVLYTQYAYPFELAAVLLLVAIIAAIALTTRARRGLKRQDINRQVNVKSADRVRLVKSMTTGNAP